MDSLVMDNISFCSECGLWIPPTTGKLRQNASGQVEAICDDCLTLGQASTQSPDTGPGKSQQASSVMSSPGEM